MLKTIVFGLLLSAHAQASTLCADVLRSWEANGLEGRMKFEAPGSTPGTKETIKFDFRLRAPAADYDCTDYGADLDVDGAATLEIEGFQFPATVKFVGVKNHHRGLSFRKNTITDSHWGVLYVSGKDQGIFLSVETMTDLLTTLGYSNFDFTGAAKQGRIRLFREYQSHMPAYWDQGEANFSAEKNGVRYDFRQTLQYLDTLKP